MLPPSLGAFHASFHGIAAKTCSQTVGVYNDTAPLSDGALEGVPFRVEVLYSDSTNARVHANGRVSEAHDASMECLFDAVEKAVRWVCAEEGA